MATKCFVAISLAIALAALALAQNPATPDLSGTWTLNLAKSKLAKGSHVQPETLAIAYSGANIQFFYTHPSGKDSTTTYTVDGKEHVIKQIQHPQVGRAVVPQELEDELLSEQIYSKAHWGKSELTVELHDRGPAPCYPPEYYRPCQNDITLRADRWSLSPDGRVLTRTSEVHTSNTDYRKQVFVYDRQ